MVSKILQLRLRQAYRFLQDIGAFYILFVLLLLIGPVLRSVEALLDEHSYNAAIFIVFIFFGIHINRSDQHFLKLINVSPPIVFISEYLMFSLPVCLVFLFTANYLSLSILTLSLLGIGLLPSPGLTKPTWVTKIPLNFMPQKAYIFKAGIRRQALLFFPIYLVTMVFIPYKIVFFIALYLLCIFIGSFYEEVEPATIIEQHNEENHFIKNTIISNSIALHLFFTPLYLLFLIFHFEYYYLIFPAFFFAQFIIMFSIYYKYAQYFPGRRKVSNSMPLMIFSVCALIPFFVPITLVYTYIYSRKSVKKIQYYFGQKNSIPNA